MSANRSGHLVYFLLLDCKVHEQESPHLLQPPRRQVKITMGNKRPPPSLLYTIGESYGQTIIDSKRTLRRCELPFKRNAGLSQYSLYFYLSFYVSMCEYVHSTVRLRMMCIFYLLHFFRRQVPTGFGFCCAFCTMGRFVVLWSIPAAWLGK